MNDRPQNASPSKIKVFMFDDASRGKEVKSVNIGGLETILCVESSPALRAAKGQKNDWVTPPKDKSQGMKVITYDSTSPERSVKQSVIDGLSTLSVREAMSAVDLRRGR